MLSALSRTLLRRQAPCAPLMARGLARPAHRVYPQWSSPPPQHELWRPNSWLGAYFKLREDDPAAVRNRERLMGRRSPTRGRFIVGALERAERDKLESQEPWRTTEYKPGDYLQVEHRPTVGASTDTIVGVMIGMHRRGLGSSFRLLCHVDGVPVEYQFMLYSPLLVNVLVRKPSEWRNKQKKLVKLRDSVKTLAFPRPLGADGRELGGRKKGGKRR